MAKKDEQNKSPANISMEQMLDALNRSGYLLENRVEHLFGGRGYHIHNSNYFVDESTNKMREIDLIAETSETALSSVKQAANGTFTFKLICECENNPQPVVFFQTDAKYANGDDGLVSLSNPDPIIPIESSPDERNRWGDSFFSSPNDFENHHFFNSLMTTQYCSFVPKDKNKLDAGWVAKHLEDQHDTLHNLLKGVVFARAKDEKNIDAYPERYYGFYQAILYYPLLILQDHLYLAQVSEGKVDLKQCDHIVYWRNHKLEKSENFIAIDVITESYLPKYLQMVEDEVEKMHSEIRANPLLEKAIKEWIQRKKEQKEIEGLEI